LISIDITRNNILSMVSLHFGNRVSKLHRPGVKIGKNIGKAWVGPYLKLFDKGDAAYYFQHSYSCL